jgi:ATP-dependent DNA helicase RecG
MTENQFIEKKRLEVVVGKNADWKALAQDCVCFANSRGGKILIGIANDEESPPPARKIDPDLPFTIRKKIAENTVNVSTDAILKVAENGGEYIELQVLYSASTIASTTDGKYYYRNDDTCVPLLPDELSRLLTDKPSFIWETKVSQISKTEYEPEKLNTFIREIQQSTRVSKHVKEKSPEEILDHYLFSDGKYLTNLGILWLGKRNDRARLLYAPTIQFFKFDERGQKINKITWDEFLLNPKELIEAVWTQIPDWKEGIEVSDGIFRKFIPNYEEAVLRELMANALAHRPYTTRGDIFINLYPDKLEVVNPGLFPIGVTPQNILHKNVRRNQAMAQVFYDLHLMDKEGSGIDKMYEVLLANGKQIPIPYQGDDFVKFTIKRHITKPEIVSFINRANADFQLTQKEIICLGLIAQHNSLSAIQFNKILSLPDLPNVIRHWLGRLPALALIKSRGKTKGMVYYVNPEYLKKVHFKGKTTLKNIESHRLEELIYQDLKIYDDSYIREIHKRIGEEIAIRKVKATLNKMESENKIHKSGRNRWTKYSLNKQV